MKFCDDCDSLLTVKKTASGEMADYCPTCAVFPNLSNDDIDIDEQQEEVAKTLDNIIVANAPRADGEEELAQFLAEKITEGLFKGFNQDGKANLELNVNLIDRPDLMLKHPEGNPTIAMWVAFDKELSANQTNAILHYMADLKEENMVVLICNQELELPKSRKDNLRAVGVGILRLPIIRLKSSKRIGEEVKVVESGDYKFVDIGVAKLREKAEWEIKPSLFLSDHNGEVKPAIIKRFVTGFRRFKEASLRDSEMNEKSPDDVIKFLYQYAASPEEAEVTAAVNFEMEQSDERKELEDDPDGGKMLVLEEDNRTVGRPSKEMYCDNCKSNEEVEYWEIQTRSADESATRFFKCLTCNKQWREYD